DFGAHRDQRADERARLGRCRLEHRVHARLGLLHVRRSRGNKDRRARDRAALTKATMQRRFMTLSALVSVFYGIVGLLATEPLASFGGFVKGVPSPGLGEFLAASYLGYGVMNWFARDTRDPVARRAIAFGNLTGWSV